MSEAHDRLTPGHALAEAADLIARAAALGVAVDAEQAGKLLRLLDELTEWNQRFNLTAIRERGAMIAAHLLDSMSAQPDLHGTRVADVGTGAGFPGLPLAVLNPERAFTLVDSTAKKLRFVEHAAGVLGVRNVWVRHARAEHLKPDVPFDTVIARAVAELPALVRAVAGLAGPDTRLLAMKGPRAEEELAALPANWRLLQRREVLVPGLDARRVILTLRKRRM
jgi:16S rRNA (guanine527-N7)-methyltransferase